MPRHGSGPKKLQSSPFRIVVGPLHEALSQESVTNRSVYPQKFVTAVLRNGTPRGEWCWLCSIFSRPASWPPTFLRLEIPTAQASSFGTASTRMQPIDPGQGVKDLNRKMQERLRREIRTATMLEVSERNCLPLTGRSISEVVLPGLLEFSVPMGGTGTALDTPLRHRC